MKDVLLVLAYFFNWRFLVALGCVTAIGLTLPERTIKLFRSVRFNIYLFLVIAIASAVGTFLTQEEGARLVYHAWWFAALLALMAFDVIVCKLRRLPLNIFGRIHSRRARADGTREQFFSKAKLKASLSIEASPEEAARRTRSWLSKLGMQAHEERTSLGTAFFGARHRAQRWGDFVLHVSIVAILAGNLMGAMFGFEEVLPIEEGKTVAMKNRPWDVSLHHFTIEYYKESGAPSVYASELEVKDRQDSAVLAKKRIVVNDPLDINRVRFYQASWGMTDNFRAAQLFLAGRVMEVHPNEVTRIPGTPLSVRANQFLPSFEIDANGHAASANFEGKNPALQIDFLDKGKVAARVWLLKNEPHTAYRVLDDGRVVPVAPPPFHFLDVDPVLFSGIQVGYDPGAPLFWASALALLVGLCMHFYMHQRRLRVLVTKKGAGSEIIIGGWNSRTPEDFQQEFSDWVGRLRRTLS